MKIYFSVIGALCIAIAVLLTVRRLRVALAGRVTEGYVVSHLAGESEGSLHYLPVVSFVDAQGREHRFTSVAGTAMRSPPAGAKVTVSYLESAPELAYINSFLHMWAAPVAFAALGVAGLAVLFVG